MGSASAACSLYVILAAFGAEISSGIRASGTGIVARDVRAAGRHIWERARIVRRPEAGAGDAEAPTSAAAASITGLPGRATVKSLAGRKLPGSHPRPPTLAPPRHPISTHPEQLMGLR